MDKPKNLFKNIRTNVYGSYKSKILLVLFLMFLYLIQFYGQTSIRLFEGFSLSFQAEYNVIRDQLSLPKGEASLEKILLKQRELATDFEFSSSIAITYTFGSRYSNIVNTRF